MQNIIIIFNLYFDSGLLEDCEKEANIGVNGTISILLPV